MRMALESFLFSHRVRSAVATHTRAVYYLTILIKINV